ncbi:MaoC family dehydratase N-terminal domain-containing protein [Rhodococcus sp. D-6]|uniref:Acyl dehydratase n=2 Tax=Rhodococcus TaxID=1827 RepID=V9XI61_9NOCA|nr:MaoC family dehydratase N-terminal domain-containing protein [Rhodococcus sp. HS-D2]AHD23156.1 acyl dehydratase [Rhodococcus pyridinivorans SB3094]
MIGDAGPVVGATIEPVVLQTDPNRVQRFGAATHNAHRIHYDTAYARSEGLADRVVMAQLHGILFFRAATRYVGDPDAVLSVGWRNRAPAYVGTTLTVTGTVREVHDDRIVLDLAERDSDGTLCAAGEAVVARR